MVALNELLSHIFIEPVCTFNLMVKTDTGIVFEIQIDER